MIFTNEKIRNYIAYVEIMDVETAQKSSQKSLICSSIWGNMEERSGPCRGKWVWILNEY
ncbi:hypothetical protein [Ruminiclostridium cellobioparum]|jgi:hypothetical protein|uniref:hypothetical protein n=1 Tax=Ruminiclostridium cellobioparum TaxID=29355 RepID=UPI000A70F9F5|nr:hypothetical protein [Ruminiclostridium cellobioparum]